VSRTPWVGDQPCLKAAIYAVNNTNALIYALDGIEAHRPISYCKIKRICFVSFLTVIRRRQELEVVVVVVVVDHS
jgi:hypothetical protein